jgi:energy-coupling factor transport system permease protein
MKIHTWSWLAWLICGLLVVSTTRNPFYLVLLALVLFIIQFSLPAAETRFPISALKFSISILLLSPLLNAFVSHFGETILVSIPKGVPLLSGEITLEAVLYGATNGLVLIVMFTLFTIINSAIPVQNLVRLIPQAFHPVAVVTTIALTFIPATQQQFQAIQDAQAIRGHRMQKLRDWLPLFIPLLVGGLERAMQIAEAMTARGYAVQSQKRQSDWHKIMLPLSLVFIILGWLVLIAVASPYPGWTLIGIGILILLILFLKTGRESPKTRFQKESWNLPSLVLLLSAVAITLLIILPLPGKETLTYDPYPRVSLPGVAIPQILAILMFLLPAFLPLRGAHAAD